MLHLLLLCALPAITEAVLICNDWEYKGGYYLSGWAANDKTRFSTVDEAKLRCMELGNNCGGITWYNGAWGVRTSSTFTASSHENSYKKNCVGFKVRNITPYLMSIAGGTRVTISGQGFSTNQFSYDNAALGNKVVFSPESADCSPITCSVLTYYTSSTKIVCDAGTPSLIVDRNYKLKISIDGTWMEGSRTNTYCGNYCRMHVRWYFTPRISSVQSQHVPTGSVLKLNGMIFSALYAAKEDSDSTSEVVSYIKRVYLNALNCNPTNDTSGDLYGTALDVVDGKVKNTGYIKCVSDSPGPTSYRPSYLNSWYGRSYTDAKLFKVDRSMRRYAIQSYNVITGVSPTEGSTEGGTAVTIKGDHFTAVKKNIDVQVGGAKCEVQSYTSEQIVCKNAKTPDKTFYPGNRGVYVEYWNTTDTGATRYHNTTEVRYKNQSTSDFVGEYWSSNTYPPSINSVFSVPYSAYYMRMRFFIGVEETDEYGFSMYSQHRGELYVSTDDTPENLVLKKSCSSNNNGWTDSRAMTAINTTLVAGKLYYVEYLAILWDHNQRGGVGLLKKTTPFTELEVFQSRKSRPSFKFYQDYNDEEQEIHLHGLINKESQGFVLKLGDRETKTLYASSDVATIQDAITETAVFQCPTIDAAESFMSVGFENGTSPFNRPHLRVDYEPYCGRWVAINSWELFAVNLKSDPKVYEWSPAGKYKNLCFALKSVQPPNFYYKVKYQGADYKTKEEGYWRLANIMPEYANVVFDGTWKYICIDMEKRIKTHDWESIWKNRIGTRSYKITWVVLGYDLHQDYFTDAIKIVQTPITENARLKAFPLSGSGLFESVKVTIKNVCNNGSTCNVPTNRVWNIKMNTYKCGYDFPLIGIKSVTAKKTNDSYISYTVSGVDVVIQRVKPITKELLGTFDMTIDGTTYQNINATISTKDLLALLRQNGDYHEAWRWNNCYSWHYRIESEALGYRPGPEINITNLIGDNVRMGTWQSGDDLGGLRLFPLYGDWIQSVHKTPQVTLKINNIVASCTSCNFTTNNTLTPTITDISPTSGNASDTLNLTGTGFGTDKSAVTVTIGTVQCTIKTVTNTSIACNVQDNSAGVHTSVVVNVAGKGDSENVNNVNWTQSGEFTDFTPKSGSEGGGTVTTLTGTGFGVDDGLYVVFGSNNATLISATYTKIIVVAPAGNGTTTVITINSDSGDMTQKDNTKFSYTSTGIAKISGVSPNYGPVGGGTLITISGENLDKTNYVSIGGVKCTHVSNSTSQYNCTTGSNDPGADEILLVTQSDGYAIGSVSFTYKLEVSAITPDSGSVVGGTVITIKGTGFGTNKSDVSVTFGQYSCNVIDTTNVQIKCATEEVADVDVLNATMEAVQPICLAETLNEMQKSAQTLHNDYRLRHKSTPTICYSHLIAKSAIAWAEYMAFNSVFKSSTSSNRNDKGENLYMFKDWSLKSDAAYIRQAIKAWYSEMSGYDPRKSTSAPRYTQMIWANVKEIGCGIAKSRDSITTPYGVYVVCHYSPTGNVEGEFATNIKAFDPTLGVTSTLTSKSVPVSVYVSTHKARKITTSQITADSCTPWTSKRNGCSDSKPSAVSGDILYTYYSCKTPLITNVTYQTAWNGDITITGSGFSTRTCTITVKVGGAKEHTCTVKTATNTSIVCNLNGTTEPPVYTKMKVNVHIAGLGDAVFSGTDYNNIYTSITPGILAISPTKGSGVGGTTIEIKGGGFIYSNNSISGTVNDGSQNFDIISATYDKITVINKAGVSGDANIKKNITLMQSGAAVACSGSCEYEYDVVNTGNVTDVSPLIVSGATVMNITGTNLCSGNNTIVNLAKNGCILKTCTETEITCDLASLPSEGYTLTLTLPNGNGYVPENLRNIQSVYSISSISPLQGSIYGGQVITIKGSNLPARFEKITTSNAQLIIKSVSQTEILVETPDRKVTKDEKDTIWFKLTNGTSSDTGYRYIYNVTLTPNISSITPEKGTYGTKVTITGNGLAPAGSLTTVVMSNNVLAPDGALTSVAMSDNVSCTVDSAVDAKVICTLADGAPKISGLRVHVNTTGYSKTVNFLYEVSVNSTVPSSPIAGSLGGPAVTIKGSGFDKSAKLYICSDKELKYTFVSARELTSTLPAFSGTNCNITVVVGKQNSTLLDHVTYDNGLTPTITKISPTDAGTGGGKTIIITGTKFVAGEAVVKFDNVTCTVKASTTTNITCTTGAKSDLSNKDGIEVRINGSLAQNPSNLTMKYQDKWSSKYTWGGGDPPVVDDLAVIQQGQIIYLDVSTPKLKALLIRGGHLIFDDNQNVTLRAEYILVLDGGSITIGTEDAPFQHEAVIEMYGNQLSTELPIYGAKTLAVRNGTVDMHGKAVTPNFCSLGVTAKAGSNNIIINTTTNWKTGDLLAISSSSFNPAESEEFNITGITTSNGQSTITLNGNLKYDHLALVQNIRGLRIETAAKVGHLTRNIKMRGNVNWDHVKEIDACPQEFDPTQFADQTCFQGRYGAELDSDQFGAQIMFHAARMHTREIIGRLENTEFTWSGQAFRLGRYAIHFHMNGDVSGSYVKGCAIHHSFNRAVTVHGVDNLLIKDNVAFNIMGHSFFLEDGGEEHNIFEGNLAIFTKTSSSLLNVDVTPASFWIVNPQNTFVNNTAAGSTHHGFWFNMPAHPGGPSADANICPRNKGMELFTGNEAHSCGKYGIWVWEHWSPKGDGSCTATTPNETTLSNFHSWHNLRGIEITVGAGIRMDKFLLHDNWFSSCEIHECAGATFEEGNTKLTNSVVLSKTASSDGLKHLGVPFLCSTGVVMPKTGLFSVHNLTAHDYTSCPVFQACGGCKPLQGGFPCNFEGIKYENSPVKAKFQWQFETILNDLDGTLAGKKNGLVTPSMDILDPSSCKADSSWDGHVCDSNTKLIRIAWNNPSLEFLLSKRVNFTNTHGNVSVTWKVKRITHMNGWMATLPSGYAYDMNWDYPFKFTNASFDMKAYYPKNGEYIFLKQILKEKPDYLTVGGNSKKVEGTISADADPGSFTFNEQTFTLTHIITGKGVNITKEQSANLKVYRCFYPNCVDPHPSPLPSNPDITKKPENPKRWSVSSDWVGTKEGWGGYNGFLPNAGQNISIPSSWWMVYDMNSDVLYDTIFVYGVLEFSSEEETKLAAKTIIVVGGKLVVGWAVAPLKVKATISLQGNRDDKSFLMSDSTEAGSKALAIFGYLEMHAEYPSVPWSEITLTAGKGSNVLTLKDNVEDKWKVGDDIVIASTSYDASEAEKRIITAVNGHNITLNKALEHEHEFYTETLNGMTYKRTAEVGLLTRLITIEGSDEKGNSQRYGARVIIKELELVSEDGKMEKYPAVGQIQGVRFKNSGQEGYRDLYDPRYSVVLINTIPAQTKSYIKGCTIDVAYNHGFGLIQAHNVEFKDNVVYNVLGSGLKTTSDNTLVDHNLVIEQRHYGIWPLSGNKEKDNLVYDACFESAETPSAVYKNNVAAGCERVGFKSQGEPMSSNQWVNNVAHSSLYGVFAFTKVASDAVKFNGFSVWSNFNFGILYRADASLLITNCVLADNKISILAVISFPHPLSHEAIDKTMTIKNTLILGRRTTSATDCSEDNNKPPMAQIDGMTYHKPPNGYKKGRVGYLLTSFSGNNGGFPTKKIQTLKTYSSIKGAADLSGVTFARFDRCDDMAMKDLSNNGDAFHPTYLKAIKFSNVNKTDNLMKLSNPSLGFVNSADCVDMPCDAKKKVLITDTDGSVFGTANTVLTSIAEFQWDGEKKWGIGDYRLPNTLTTAMNGSFIDPSIHYPNHGIVRTTTSNKVGCSKDVKINMYKCTGIQYRMLIIESLDGDTETRRISPVAISTEDGYVDLINGPMDHGWCSGYTCQQRISTFYAVVALGKIYKIHFTSTMPQNMRYYLIRAGNNDKIRIDVWYAKPQRLDVYYKGSYKAPTNAKKQADGTYSYVTDKTAAELYPKITSNDAGENFFDSKQHFLSILIKGPDPFTVKTSPKIVLSLTVEDVTVDDFFKKNIIANLAALLNVPEAKIKIAEIVSEGGRKRATSTTLKVEISEPVVESEKSMNTTKTTEMAASLTAVTATFVKVVQRGQLSDKLKVTVKNIKVQLPEAPPADTRNATIDQAEAEKVTDKSYAEVQAELEAKKQATTGDILVPKEIKSINTPSSVAMLSNTLIYTKVLNAEGTVVTMLGAGKEKWRATVSIFKGPDNARLVGTDEVTFINGYANFTDVRFTRSGDYNISIKVTYPSDFPYEVYVGLTCTKLPESSKSRRIQFKFSGDYDKIVTDATAFLLAFKTELEKKFPGVTLADYDVYEGSIIVEVTVSSASSTATADKIAQMKTKFEEGFDWTYNGHMMTLKSFSGDGDAGGGTSGGTIALAVILAIVLVAVLIAGAFFVYKKKLRRKTVPDDSIVMSNRNTDKGFKDANVPQDTNEYTTGEGVNKSTAPKLDEDEDNWISQNPPKQNPLSILRRKSLQKVWKTIKRYDEEEDLSLVQELEEKFEEISNNLWKSDPYEWGKCASCNLEKKTWPCPICRQVYYCSKECQQTHWPNHYSGNCRPRSAGNEHTV